MSDETAPYVATIKLDLFVYGERARAAAVLEQIVAMIDDKTTNDRGGVSFHHRVTEVALAVGPK